MVDFFKQYSLENKSIRPSDWKIYSKKKLIEKVSGVGAKTRAYGEPDPSLNPINQIIMRNVIALEKHRLGLNPTRYDDSDEEEEKEQEFEVDYIDSEDKHESSDDMTECDSHIDSKSK